MSTPGRAIQVGAFGVGAAVVGGSLAATSAATLIVATGGSAALLLAGAGLYKYLSSRDESEEKEGESQ